MTRACLLTAIYDRYDSLKPHVPQLGADPYEAICVTDNRDLAGGVEDPLGWTIIYEPRPSQHPNRAAKVPKMLPWFYTDAQYVLWIDASFHLRTELALVSLMSYVDDNPIAQFVHPWRDCIYDEGDESEKLVKYKGEPIDIQMARYRQLGHPEHWGLWATGVIARRVTDPRVHAFGYYWLAENNAYSFQDQLSEAPMLRQASLRPASLPGTHMSNDWLAYDGSPRHG
jgi:hypothetical protein